MANVSPEQNAAAEKLFNDNYAAIQQAKQQTGDWEKAFQSVTGQAWPHGEGVVIDQGGAHAHKDQSVLSKVAKIASIAAPLAATIFTGGAASPWLVGALGAGTGALSGATNGGGWKGALKAGAIGGATSYGGAKLANMMKAAQVAKAGGAVSHAAGSGAGDFSDVSSALGVGAPASVSAPAGSSIEELMRIGMQQPTQLATSPGVGMDFVGPIADTIKGEAGGGGWKDTIKNLFTGKDSTQNFADIGSTLGAFGQAKASNRKTEGDFMQGYDRLNIGASAENRARESDAMKHLAQTSYIMDGGAKPINRQVNSGTLPDFGFGPKPSSDAQKQGASTLQTEMLNRLTPEGQIKPTDPSTYVKPSTAENVATYGALGTGIGSVLSSLLKK